MPTSKLEVMKSLRELAGSLTEEAFVNSLAALRSSNHWEGVGSYFEKVWLPCKEVRLKHKWGVIEFLFGLYNNKTLPLN